ncbi:MAG: ABC transporter ATP-binding protein [Holophagales bacterium]|nr:ABC transporter ATP-binding protein [Holophagales bacterium]
MSSDAEGSVSSRPDGVRQDVARSGAARPGAAGPFLELRGLSKSFGEVRVLEDLHLELAEGEILALLGLSGSGKTTALRLLAGFESPDSGEIRIDGNEVSRLAPDRRGFGMVFQHYALFPHMTVRENVAFGLEAQGWAKSRVGSRIQEMLTLVDLEGFAGRRVSEISGGQQQRVALARALAPEPRLLLLDEPLSNLDPALRERTRSELRQAVKRIGITTVLVTHEQEEAFHVGDRIAVLNAGRLEQVGSAADLYRRPATRFVASFVGRSSSLPVRLTESTGTGRQATVRIELAEGSGDGAVWHGVASRSFEAGEPADLLARPESLRLEALAESSGEPGPAETGSEGAAGLHGRVVDLRYTGPLTYAVVALDTRNSLEVLLDGHDALAGGESAGLESWVGGGVRVSQRALLPGGRECPPPRLFPRVGR